MDIEEIKTLTDLMVDNDLSEIMIHDGDKRILLRRKGSNVEPPNPAPAPAASASLAAPAAAPTPAAIPAPESGLQAVTAPMVGTFYAGPDPESPPFVKIGDRVTPDTVVCIIEAMKVFNEIRAEMAGTVESIEVRNEAPVEYGQALIMVRPD